MTTRKEKNNPRYETERESMKIHEASKILILGQIVGFTVKRGAVVTTNHFFESLLKLLFRYKINIRPHEIL